MSELPELEARIGAALARIRAGVETLAATSAATDTGLDGASAAEAKVAELTAKLDEEQTVNAQLEERVRLLQERQDGKVAELESGVEAARARAARMDRELQRLRDVNAQLRSNNTQLRDAVARGVSDPNLVNKAMMAELEALRATRSADVAEMDAIMEELTPIVQKEARNARG